jgi:hypothetical protein
MSLLVAIHSISLDRAGFLSWPLWMISTWLQGHIWTEDDLVEGSLCPFSLTVTWLSITSVLFTPFVSQPKVTFPASHFASVRKTSPRSIRFQPWKYLRREAKSPMELLKPSGHEKPAIGFQSVRTVKKCMCSDFQAQQVSIGCFERLLGKPLSSICDESLELLWLLDKFATAATN